MNGYERERGGGGREKNQIKSGIRGIDLSARVLYYMLLFDEANAKAFLDVYQRFRH